MKLIKIAALGLVGLVTLAVLVLLFGVPAGPLTDYISDQVAKAGYQLRIDGPARISLSSSLNFSADDIRLRQGDADLVTAKHMRAGLSLTGFLTGEPRMTELAVIEPVIRLTSGRSTPRRDRSSTRAPGVALDRITVENGTLIMRDVRENLEGRIDAIALTASAPAQGPLELTAQGKAGDQIVRISAKANSSGQLGTGRATPVEAKVELPGVLNAPLALTARVNAADQVMRIDDIRGTLGSGRITGSVAIDVAGARPRATADLVADRIALAPAEGAPPARNGAWSDQPIDFAVLRVFDASLKLSARDLTVRSIRLASADVGADLTGGLLSIQLSRGELYGGLVQGKLVLDAASPTPRHGASFDFSRVDALALLTEAIGFDHLEGRLQAKLDLTAAGAIPAAIMASLGGTAQLTLENGAIRDVNVPGMVRALTRQTVQGWQEQGGDKTELSALAATFRLANGQATTDDLRLVGPLVRMTGSGTVNLPAQTLDFRVEPKLVLSLQGQGAPAQPPQGQARPQSQGQGSPPGQGSPSEPAGLGVPVVIRGAWSEPKIYPDIAGILENPEAAFNKLKAMGGALLGLDQQSGGKPTVDQVIKGIDQMIHGNKQPSGETRGRVRDVIRDLFRR